MDISITANKAYCYAWCNAYELETEYITAITNNAILNSSAFGDILFSLDCNMTMPKAICNANAFGDILFSLDCNMTMPKAICNCSANIATIDLDNLKFPKYTFTTSARNLNFEG